MNNLFIILLAIGLASAHTFVKRDVPAESSRESYVEAAKKQLQEFANPLQHNFDPEVIKNNFNFDRVENADKIADAINKLKPKKNKQ